MALVEPLTTVRPPSPRESGRPAAVRVRRLSRSFGALRVLDDVRLDVAPGEIVALVGRSGSGKSTLLRVLAGLDDGATGAIERPGSVAVAFQDARLLPWKRVAANVALGLRGPDVGARVTRVLDEVGLAERAQAWPLTLSGGEAQRASLARALAREPELLLLDEPFGALDALTRLVMHDLVLRLWERHRPAVLLVTHDVEEAIALADRVVVLDGGRLAVSVDVDLPRPRARTGPEFGRLREQLLHALGVEVPAVEVPAAEVPAVEVPGVEVTR